MESPYLVSKTTDKLVALSNHKIEKIQSGGNTSRREVNSRTEKSRK